MKLVGSLTSPYVRKIRVMLAEKGVAYDFEKESPWEATTHVPDYNPLGKVPALVTDEGTTLFDSSIIAEHIEIAFPAHPLLPADRRTALPVRQTVTLADGITDAGVALFLENKRPPERQDAAWIERQRGKILRGLDALERQLGGRQWLHDDSLSLADIAAGCMLFWLDFRLPQLDTRSAHPALAALAVRLAERTSFQQSIPVA